jgi:hypothetical protein
MECGRSLLGDGSGQLFEPIGYRQTCDRHAHNDLLRWTRPKQPVMGHLPPGVRQCDQLSIWPSCLANTPAGYQPISCHPAKR